jgi:hypothetical protein
MKMNSEWFHRTVTGFALVTLLLCAATLAGCHSNTSPYPPRPPDYPIELTEYDFKESYEELGQAKTAPYDDRLLDTQGMGELRKIARKMGGDAVVRISRNSDISEEVGYRPGALLRVGTKFVNKTSLTGVVVRFRRAGMPVSAPTPALPPQPAPPSEKPAPAPKTDKPTAALPAPPPVLPQPYEPPTPVPDESK